MIQKGIRLPKQNLYPIVTFFLVVFLMAMGCKSSKEAPALDAAFEILTDEGYSVINTNAKLEVIDSGYTWTEGPLWLEDSKTLLFNDIPSNTTYAWTENGTNIFLRPSGYTDPQARGGEPGANGLLLDSKGALVLCQHGDRRMARMDAPLDNPQPTYTTIVDTYDGNRFSSPNDATFSSSGNLYFTDPPYGLADPGLQETPFNGVYRYSNEGALTLLDSTLTRPNGIAFSPDEKTLYVANSDPERAIWMRYSIDEKSGTITEKKVFFDATEYAKTEKGLPDGLKVNQEGYVFASGPGGIWIFNPDGTPVARIKTGQATSNCAFGTSDNVLFMTADDYLMRATL